MKAVACVLLVAVVVTVSGDTGYYSAPSGYRPHKQHGILDRVSNGIRRQGPATLLANLLGGAGPVVGAVLAVVLGIAVVAFTSAAVSEAMSGRGLDTDAWELNHSDWLDTLTRDFENSWADA